MDSFENIRHELCRLDDMVNNIEHKIHSLSGVLELVCLGIQAVNKSEDSYELSSVEFIRDYLKDIEKRDIPEINVINLRGNQTIFPLFQIESSFFLVHFRNTNPVK